MIGIKCQRKLIRVIKLIYDLINFIHYVKKTSIYKFNYLDYSIILVPMVVVNFLLGLYKIR